MSFSVDTAAPFEFSLERIENSKVIGWAWLPGTASSRAIILFEAYGKVLFSFRADRFRGDCRDAGKGDGYCGFEVDIPKELCDGVHRSFSLRLVGADKPFYFTPVMVMGSGYKQPLRYYCDRVDGAGAAGWVFSPADPMARVVVEILCDGVVVGETCADQFRADVREVGIGDGNYGFDVKWGPRICDGTVHQVAFRQKGFAVPFHVESPRRYSEPVVDFDEADFTCLKAIARVPGHRYVSVTLELRINGKSFAEISSDNDGVLDWKLEAQSFAPIVDAIAGLETGEAAFEVALDGQVLHEAAVVVVAGNTGGTRAIVGGVNNGRLRLMVVADRDFEPHDLVLQVGDFEVKARKISALGPLAAIVEADLRSLDLRGQIQTLVLRLASADAPLINCDIEIRRYSVAVAIEDETLVVDLVHHLGEARHKIIEILLDERPIVQESLRLDRTADGWAGKLLFPLPRAWRNGDLHALSVRVVGSPETWPKQKLLFRSGAVSDHLNARVEKFGERELVGWAFLSSSPETILTATLKSGGREIACVDADQPHPVLDGQMLKAIRRGFRFDIDDLPAGGYSIQIESSGKSISSLPLEIGGPTGPYVLQDANFGRTGRCFIVPTPLFDVSTRESARLVLFAAAAVADEPTPITVAMLSPLAIGQPLEFLVEDLVGRANALRLAKAAFVVVPTSPLPSTVDKIHDAAYRLDNWLRANNFSQVIGAASGGHLASAISYQRQGLAGRSASFIVLVDRLSVADAMENGSLIDDPNLLFVEAQERRALREADCIISRNSAQAESLEDIVARVSDRVKLIPVEIGAVDTRRVDAYEQDLKYITFLGPFQLAASLSRFCDAVDRLCDLVPADMLATIGIAFIGSDDLIKETRATKYIRDRSKSWPMSVRVHADPTWDSYGRLVASLNPGSFVVVPPRLVGSEWDRLAQATGLGRLVLTAQDLNIPRRLAQRFVKALGDGATFEDADPAPALATLLASLQPRTQVDRRENSDGEPLVSVCVSHHNRPTLLRQTLESIAANDYANKEIIIVDDGSSAEGVDTELNEIESWLAEHNGRLVRQDNAYLGAARNAAVRAAKGDLIVFMDDDNLAAPGMITTFVNVLHASNADLVTAQFAFFNNGDIVDCDGGIPELVGVPAGSDVATGAIANTFGDANMLIRRSAFETIGGFSEDYGLGHEDWELFTRAAIAGLRHEVINRVCFWYRVSPNSMLRSQQNKNLDLLRNIRAFSGRVSPEVYRLILCAQGLTARWDRGPKPLHAPVVPGLTVTRGKAWGRVAVIMRTKNRPLLLRRAIKSVVDQTFANWVLVVINDGGDATEVRACLKEQERLLQGRYLQIDHPRSLGMENASNAGIAASISEFLVIHDDDDSWSPEYLSRCVAHLDAAPPSVAGVVSHVTLVVEEIVDNRVEERSRQLSHTPTDVDLARMFIENQFPPISFLFRRSALEAVGGFNGDMPVLGDWDFHLRMASRFEIGVVKEPLAFYHHRKKGTAGANGNTVTEGADVHRSQRIKFVNGRLRESVSAGADTNAYFFNTFLYNDIIEKFLSVSAQVTWLEKLIRDGADQMKWIEKLMKDEREHTKYLEKIIKNNRDTK